ncbi:hypothetical protein [Sphingomonas sp. Mn802worker]|uniref:hypothetical protein n=1 Tax=Sphingomonas sp. Mn802worker TaxID=629773 RepID=UPI0012EA13A3|nr:hypothetical protein [Sphingomonas sp. Mn802worker]
MLRKNQHMGRIGALSSPRGIVSALMLAIASLALAWLSFRTTITAVLPAQSPVLLNIAPRDADNVLSRASLALVASVDPRDPMSLGFGRKPLDLPTIAAVRHAATQLPLDERPYLILGQEQLAAGQTGRGIRILEAGQRLEPRNRLIHLALLVQYLKTSRFGPAAAQMSVLSRLISRTQPFVTTALAQMILMPDTAPAAKRTLQTDPGLERSVLTTLAKSTTPPDQIFALASPRALADAGNSQSWGPVLVSRLVEANHFTDAHRVWQRIYRLPAAAVTAPIFNPQFRAMPASPPFDWTLAANGLGAADPDNGELAVDYYGRDSGNLADQMLVLSPGRYQLVFATEGGKPNAASQLFWTVACASGDKSIFANIAVPTTPGSHRAGSPFMVPATCPAQTLTLRGEAGEFPSPVSLTIKGLAIRAAGMPEARP